jgi:hypothetical protein
MAEVGEDTYVAPTVRLIVRSEASACRDRPPYARIVPHRQRSRDATYVSRQFQETAGRTQPDRTS